MKLVLIGVVVAAMAWLAFDLLLKKPDRTCQHCGKPKVNNGSFFECTTCRVDPYADAQS